MNKISNGTVQMPSDTNGTSKLCENKSIDKSSMKDYFASLIVAAPLDFIYHISKEALTDKQNEMISKKYLQKQLFILICNSLLNLLPYLFSRLGSYIGSWALPGIGPWIFRCVGRFIGNMLRRLIEEFLAEYLASELYECYSYNTQYIAS